MAYTLTDQLRPLRLVMRLNGAIVGLTPGLLLFILPGATLTAWGIYAGGSLWPLRAVGALLLALGLLFVLAASQEAINLPLLLCMTVANGLLALVLLIAYLQRELAGLSIAGRLLLIVIFLFCLIGAVTPLRYRRSHTGG